LFPVEFCSTFLSFVHANTLFAEGCMFSSLASFGDLGFVCMSWVSFPPLNLVFVRELSIACGMFDLKNVKLMLDLGCCDDV
ncbi:Proline-rich receptor-like protein kinase PERK8 isoform C, partial [Glycine soja]